MLGYKSNNNVVYSSKYHVVWCPKYRRKVLVDAIAKRLFGLIHKAALRYRAEVIALEIMPDHDLRKEFPSLSSRLPSLWTNSYFVSTVGGAPLEVIKQYVEKQKKV